MATDLERLVVQLSADVKGYENALKRAGVQTNRAAGQIEQRFQRMNKNVSANFANVFRGVATGAAVRQIVAYADAWTVAGNKIAAASQISGRQARSLEELNKLAAATRSGLSETVDLYTSLLRATTDVAESEAQVARATEILNKAFKAGGQAATEQAAGILQLSQALSSGVLQGDELRSIRENAPLLAQAIADEFNTTIGGLKELGAQGELTADRIFAAILKAGPKIEAAFATTESTISDAMTLIGNAIIEAVGSFDDLTGASGGVVAEMGKVAQAIRDVSTVINALAKTDIGRAITALNELQDFLASWGVVLPTDAWGQVNRLANIAGAAADAVKAGTGESDLLKTAQDIGEISRQLDKAQADLAEIEKAKAFTGIDGGAQLAHDRVKELTDKLIELNLKLQETGNIAAQAADRMADGFEKARIAAQGAFKTATIPLMAGDMAKQVIRQFEGFRAGAYWDTNAYRIGYGSDTLGGTGKAVTSASMTTKEEAERDLDVRIAAFQRTIVEQIGAAFASFTEPVQAALTSVAYNYGRLPESVAAAARTGDTEAVARAVESLSANPQRRAEEAALIRTGQFGLTETHAAEVEARADAEKDAADALAEQNERLAEQKELINQLNWDKYLEDRAIALESQIERLDAMRDLSSDVFGGIVSDLRAGASAGEIFANVLDKIIAKLGDMAVNMLTTALFGASGTAQTGLLGSLLGVPALAGARAGGGPVMAGSSYMVGEAGPEIFTPSVGGSILPNSQTRMGGELRGVIAVQPSPLFITSVQMATGRMISENNRRMPAYLADRQRRGI